MLSGKDANRWVIGQPVQLQKLFSPRALVAAFRLHAARELNVALDQVKLQGGVGKVTGPAMSIDGLQVSGGVFEGTKLVKVGAEAPALSAAC